MIPVIIPVRTPRIDRAGNRYKISLVFIRRLTVINWAHICMNAPRALVVTGDMSLLKRV